MSSAPVLLNRSTVYFKTVFASAIWYISATVLIVLNKVLMEKEVRLPVLLTSLHMLASFLWCEFSACAGWSQKSQKLNFGREMLGVVILSLTQGISVLLVVVSLRYVEVSFEQALSASTPAFTALVGILILGKSQRVTVWLALVPVIGGAFLCFTGEPNVHIAGVSYILMSNLLRATKSCLQESLLKNTELVGFQRSSLFSFIAFHY